MGHKNVVGFLGNPIDQQAFESHTYSRDSRGQLGQQAVVVALSPTEPSPPAVKDQARRQHHSNVLGRYLRRGCHGLAKPEAMRFASGVMGMHG